MALTFEIDNASALVMLDAYVDRFDSGAGAAVIQFRTGAQPANCEAANTGTLLGSLTCSDPACGNAADIAPGARATFSAITSDTSADATDTVAHARLFESTLTTCYWQCTVATSGGDITIDDAAIVTGGTIAISALTIDLPES